MVQQIRILLIEDDPDDAQLVMAEVGRADFDSEFVHVAARVEAKAALESGEWDLILTDFGLPDMTALDLLQWVRELQIDVPVIVVSGTIGEEMAVLTMHAGAHDFIHKNSLTRLNPAIERELQEMAIHRQRWLAETALIESEQNFRQLTEAIPEVFWLIDCTQQQMVYLSPAFEAVWEKPAAQAMSHPESLLETVHPDDYDRITEIVRQKGWGGLSAEYRIQLHDGGIRWIKTRSFPILDEQGGVVRIAGLSIDITERMLLQQEREMMSRALEQSADAVMITDAAGIIIYVNPAFEDLTGYQGSELLGKKPNILKSGFQEDSFYRSMWSSITSGIPFTEIFINRRKDGELYYEAKTITPVRDTEGEICHYVSTGKDITDRIKTKERLNRVMNYDAVTGLANRILLQDRLNQAALRYKRQQSEFGMLCIGIELRELLGKEHDTRMVEELQRQVAQRISSCVDGQDTVARTAEGEFMILHRDHERAMEEMETLAKELVLAFSTPLVSEGYKLFLTPSIGISLFSDNTDEPDRLMDNARIAMIHARRSGHGGYSFYQGGMLAKEKYLSS